jgi:hypothetical protein
MHYGAYIISQGRFFSLTKLTSGCVRLLSGVSTAIRSVPGKTVGQPCGSIVSLYTVIGLRRTGGDRSRERKSTTNAGVMFRWAAIRDLYEEPLLSAPIAHVSDSRQMKKAKEQIAVFLRESMLMPMKKEDTWMF